MSEVLKKNTTKADYLSTYLAAARSLYDTIENTCIKYEIPKHEGAQISLSQFCESRNLFPFYKVLIKNGIINNVNKGRGKSAQWRWQGPIPNVQMIKSMLASIHLVSLESYACIPKEDLNTLNVPKIIKEKSPTKTRLVKKQDYNYDSIEVKKPEDSIVESKFMFLWGLIYFHKRIKEKNVGSKN